MHEQKEWREEHRERKMWEEENLVLYYNYSEANFPEASQWAPELAGNQDFLHYIKACMSDNRITSSQELDPRLLR